MPSDPPVCPLCEAAVEHIEADLWLCRECMKAWTNDEVVFPSPPAPKSRVTEEPEDFIPPEKPEHTAEGHFALELGTLAEHAPSARTAFPHIEGMQVVLQVDANTFVVQIVDSANEMQYLATVDKAFLEEMSSDPERAVRHVQRVSRAAFN